jgi:hypothetical protein
LIYILTILEEVDKNFSENENLLMKKLKFGDFQTRELRIHSFRNIYRFLQELLNLDHNKLMSKNHKSVSIENETVVLNPTWILSRGYKM